MGNFALLGAFILLGMALRRLPATPPGLARGLNLIALYLSLPAMILLKAPQISFSSEVLVPALTPWGMLLLSAALVLAVARLRGWSRETTGVLLLVVPLGNTSFMGVPMVQAFFGEGGLPYLIVYDQFGTIAIFATYGAVILALYGRQGASSVKAVARRVVTFPPTIALVAGLSLRSWLYPPELTWALQGIAATLTPLVMTAIGFQLRWRLRPSILAPLSFGLGVKLLVAPVVALAIFRLAGLHGLATDVAVFEAAMPPMVIAGALAVAAGLDAELSVAMVGLGVIFSFATLPLTYFLLQLF
ncbi:MAG: AEC family transporter [Desulfuromonadales bacterium]|nr:AEC family transporter [Desulfuromonadales bacterium]